MSNAHLVVGKGEVGTALSNVLKDHFTVYVKDIEPLEVSEPIEVLHVCFPPSDSFSEAVKAYQEQYKPKLTIIHSSVYPGTSRALGAVHSPIHGKHPNLEGGIKTFVKYVGGDGLKDKKAKKAVRLLKAAGIKARLVDNSETSELSKLWCTTYYNAAVIVLKEIMRDSKKFGANFEQVYGWNRLYNKGYKKYGMPQFLRPVLNYTPGAVGGHCLVPNALLLCKHNPFAQMISGMNAFYAVEKSGRIDLSIEVSPTLERCNHDKNASENNDGV